MSSKSPEGLVQIVNIAGKVVKQFKAKETLRWQNQSIGAGVYLIRWKSKKGQHYADRLIIAQ